MKNNRTERIVKMQGEKLKELRKAAGFKTQAEFAECAGYTGISAISQYESGSRPISEDVAKKLAVVLNVSPDEILCKRKFYPYPEHDSRDPDLTFLLFLKTIYGIEISFFGSDLKTTDKIVPNKSNQLIVPLSKVENLSFNFAAADLKKDQGSVWIEEVILDQDGKERIRVPYYLFAFFVSQIRDDIEKRIQEIGSDFRSLWYYKGNMTGWNDKDPLFSIPSEKIASRVKKQIEKSKKAKE